MKIEYSKLFLKDIKKINHLKIFNEIKSFSFEEIYSYTSITEIKNLKKMVGFSDYYRIRKGDYRIGFKFIDNRIVFLRVLHRKEIYKFFP